MSVSELYLERKPGNSHVEYTQSIEYAPFFRWCEFKGCVWSIYAGEGEAVCWGHSISTRVIKHWVNLKGCEFKYWSVWEFGWKSALEVGNIAENYEIFYVVFLENGKFDVYD